VSIAVTLLADALVAILLVATIVSSMRLSRRIALLKGDEAALKQTIGDLMVATGTAERAILGLRTAIDECDRTLAERLASAERYAGEIAGQVQAGEGVISRIGAIVAQMQAVPRPPAPPVPAPPAPVPPVTEGPNNERLGAAAAAALAMTERALSRVRSRAA
jgi:hypothetical protein